MTPVAGIRLELARSLNPFVAADICIKDRVLTRMCSALQAAAMVVSQTNFSDFLEELAALPVGVALSPEAILRASFDEGGMELLCTEYLAQLRLRGLGRESKFDPVLIADLIGNRLIEGTKWPGGVSLHAHDWTLGRRYKLNGWHILVPIIIAFDLGLPALAELRALDRCLDRIGVSGNALTVRQIAAGLGLDEMPNGQQLIQSCAANRWDVYSSIDQPNTIGSTTSSAPYFELLSRHARDHGWLEAANVSLRAYDQPAALSYDPRALGAFIKHHNCTHAEGAIGLEQLAVKALLLSYQPEEPVQGIRAIVHRMLLGLLIDRQAVVSITHLRQYCGLPNLRISPFAVQTGRILVYAPSARFLEPNAVSFALREWVQDSTHSKARISPDRIFTPLAPIDWPLNRSDLVMAARSTSTFRNFGIAFWPEIKPRMGANVARQAKTWADHHLEREASKVLREAGLVRIGDVYLDPDSWAYALQGEQPLAEVARSVVEAGDVSLREREEVMERLALYGRS